MKMRRPNQEESLIFMTGKWKKQVRKLYLEYDPFCKNKVKIHAEFYTATC